jgi:hypothetical protein
MVILCHRPDAFEQDDPRGGEVDLILGKHRNGPTKTKDHNGGASATPAPFRQHGEAVGRFFCRDAMKIDKRVLIV